jgi:hypothetical protein
METKENNSVFERKKAFREKLEMLLFYAIV